MRDDLTALLSALVRCDSVNPSLVLGGAGETEVAEVVTRWAHEHGLRTRRFERVVGRPSVTVTAPGTGGGRTLLLCGHLDTVTTQGMADPHGAQIVGDALHGRGAYDMKGGVAAALVACRDAAGHGLAGDVVVACVADEEHASLGMQEVLEAVVADGAVVTEPTELRVATAHKGFVWIDVEVTGRAAHGSRPHLGVDAIVKAGRVLTALGELDERLAARTHPLLGRASVHASVIAGGDERSSYPGWCRLGLERRTLPGEAAADVEAEVAALLASCRREDPGLVVEQRTTLVREPFEADGDDPLVGRLRASVAATLGDARPDVGVSYWADAAFLAAAGIPTALFGPAGEGAHAAAEHVSLRSCQQVADVLADLARSFCR